MPERTSLLYYLAKFLSEGGFYIPIWLFYMTGRCGMSESQAFLLQSSLFVAIMLSEVPSGAWADRLGRRKLLIFSAMLRIAGLLIYVSSCNFYFLILSNLLAGLASSASSGTIEALVTDNLIFEGRDSKGTFENGHAMLFLGRALAVVAGGYLYLIEPVLPYYAALVFAISYLIVVLWMKELPFSHSSATNNFAHFRETARIVSRNFVIRRWLLCASAILLFSNISWFQYQSIFSSFGWTAPMIGWIYCWGALCSSAGAWVTKRWLDVIDSRQVLVGGALLWAAGSLSLTVDFIPVILSGVLLSSLACGAFYPAYVRLANQAGDASHRATMISLIGFLDVITCGIGTALTGYFNQALGAVLFMRIVGLALMLFAFLPIVIVPRIRLLDRSV